MNNQCVVKRMAEIYRIPQKTIRYLMRCGILTETLDTERDLHILEFFGWCWGDCTLLRAQLASLTRTRRRRLVETADLNRWEQYAFGRYQNAGMRLAVATVAVEVEAIFGVRTTEDVVRRISQIRRRVQNARHYQLKKIGISREDL